MAQKKSAETVKFNITVDDLAVPDDAVATIEARLRSVMLEELARIDTGGDLVAKPLPTARDFDGGRTAGFSIGRG